jgi:hypothetical protein
MGRLLRQAAGGWQDPADSGGAVMTRAAKSKPDEQGQAERTQRLSPELVKARRLCEKRWSPPKALLLSVLKQVPRPPLMDVLNFLAFGKPAPPKKISPLMRVAHWNRALRALCAAARDGKVKLWRTSAEGSSQAIAPPEFDFPLALDDEQGTIGVDLGALTVERFARAWEENRLWRDVRVERESLISWVQELDMAPKNAAPKVVGPKGGRPSSMTVIETELDRWIAGGIKLILERMQYYAPARGDLRTKGRLARALSNFDGERTASGTIQKRLSKKLDKALALIISFREV